MTNIKGTPKTLKQAIEDGQGEQFPSLHVQDFLAQKFTAAIMLASESEVKVLEKLWSTIVAIEETEETFETKVDLRAS